jgi:FixJ family two-component response regulator
VEDDTSMLRSIQRLLTMEGFVVEAYASAEAFLDRKSEGRIECLVLDIQLPRMSGIELQQRLVATHCDISIIFMTALEDESLRHVAVQLGCVAYLRKPFQPEALVTAIADALGDR